jgi:hypothetical protein
MKKRVFLKIMMAVLLVAFGALIFLAGPETGHSQATIKKGALEVDSAELYPTSEYGWLTYYMHEVYERYMHGKDSFEKGNYELADANIAVLKVFTELSKEQLPDTLQDGKPFDKEGYVKSIDQMNKYLDEIRKNLKNKKWANVEDGKLDPVMQTCVGCHASYNIPTDFRIDTKFKVLTHTMHEIYELYRQIGPMLQKQDWDNALYCFVVLKPYIESIPNNIPEVNQDGDKIDTTLFKKAYDDLNNFNLGITKKLEGKTWQTGKPLPPPRVVVDNCYACHTKAAKIPPPW